MFCSDEDFLVFKVLVHHLLFEYQMRDFVENLGQLAHIRAPSVESLDVRLARAHVDDARRSLDLRVGDDTSDDQITQEGFHLLQLQLTTLEYDDQEETYVDRKLEQLGHPIECNLSVVLGDHTNVVLADTLLERLPALVAIIGEGKDL